MAAMRSSTPLCSRAVPRNMTTRPSSGAEARSAGRWIVTPGAPRIGVSHVRDEDAAEAVLEKS